MNDVEYWYSREGIASVQKTNEQNCLFNKDMFTLDNVRFDRKKEWLIAKGNRNIIHRFDAFGEGLK